MDAYGYGASDERDEALYGSANQVIGSDPLPDLFTAYPDSAYRLDQIAPLMDLRNYFSEEALAKYRPEFLQDGIWEAVSYTHLPALWSCPCPYSRQSTPYSPRSPPGPCRSGFIICRRRLR